MESVPQQVAIIGDDVSNDLGGGAKELGLHRFLGKIFMQKKIYC
jgi:FMN phosphatase YigB (HAD superfamily)